MTNETSVCIIDFAGNNRQPGCWCDYYPENGVTTFGGFWCEVPDLITKRQPSEQKCEAHAKKYREQSLRGYLKFLEFNDTEIEEHIKSAKKTKKFYPRT